MDDMAVTSAECVRNLTAQESYPSPSGDHPAVSALRVLIVHQPIDGGVGRHVVDLAHGLAAAGHEPILCGPSRPPGSDPSVPHVSLALTRAITPRQDLLALRRMLEILDRLKPDLVHAHSSKAGAIARLARLRHPRVPVLYTPHGYAFAGYFTDPAARRRYLWVERALAPLTSAVVCVCRAEARLAGRVVSRRRIRVVHNGLPAAAYERDDLTRDRSVTEGPMIGTLSQLRPGKGMGTLLTAFAEVLAREPSACLVIFGAGPEGDALLARARALGIAHRVDFRGATGDPLAAIRELDVFCLPSEAEAFPYVLLEAMAVARPIVASDVGGIGEALGAGTAGLLVAPADAGALADAICSLLRDPAHAAHLAGQARSLARTCFTLDEMIAGILDVYGTTLARRARWRRSSVQRDLTQVGNGAGAIRRRPHEMDQADPHHALRDLRHVDRGPRDR